MSLVISSCFLGGCLRLRCNSIVEDMSWDMADEQICCPEISSNRGDYIQLTRPLKYLVIAGCLAAPS